MKENNIPIGISLHPNLVKKIDGIRGLIPRSRFIAKLVSEGLDTQ